MISLILVSILIMLKVQLNGRVELLYQHISGYIVLQLTAINIIYLVCKK